MEFIARGVADSTHHPCGVIRIPRKLEAIPAGHMQNASHMQSAGRGVHTNRTLDQAQQAHLVPLRLLFAKFLPRKNKSLSLFFDNGGQCLMGKVEKIVDPRHSVFKDLIFRCYRYMNDEESVWDGSDAKALDTLLKGKPDLTEEKFHRWLIYYSDSLNINPADRPRKFIPNLMSYCNGPLNEFGRPLAQKRRLL